MRSKKMFDENQKVYFVIDMKSFFASVECAERGLDPFKTNLVVADSSRTEGTVCLAITPKMKKLGIRNRCRLFEIPKEVKYIIAKPRMKKYIDYAAEIYGIYLNYIAKEDIHVYSIDECFLDVTEYLKLYKIDAKSFAKLLMNEIYNKLKIPSSCGIGTNLFLAKIALDITAKKSKDAIGWLDETKFKIELWNHIPITDFWQISTGTASRLEKFGVTTMKEITEIDEEILYKEFGVNAELLIDHANGRESCTMQDIKNYKRKSKSFGSSQILPQNYNFENAKLILKEMIGSGCVNLINNGYVTQLVHVFVGYGDVKHDVSKGTIRMSVTTNLPSIIESYAVKLFDKIVDKQRPIRKIGYDFSQLMPEEMEQYDFFTDLNKVSKEKNLTKSIITLQNKFGKNSVLRAIDFEEKATLRQRNNMIGGHNAGEK